MQVYLFTEIDFSEWSYFPNSLSQLKNKKIKWKSIMKLMKSDGEISEFQEMQSDRPQLTGRELHVKYSRSQQMFQKYSVQTQFSMDIPCKKEQFWGISCHYQVTQ